MNNLDNMTASELRSEVEQLREKVKNLEKSYLKLQNTEEKLDESELRLKSILNNTTAMIYVKKIDGQYMFVNKRYEEIFHVFLNDIIGKSDYDFHSPEFAGKFVENDLKVLEAEKTIEFEEEALHDDGVHNYISLKFPLYQRNGAIYAVCGISTDITGRKKSENEKVKVIEELKEALTKVKQLHGLMPICCICKRIRDDQGYWRAVEKYVEENSNIKFTDGMCPECHDTFGDLTDKEE